MFAESFAVYALLNQNLLQKYINIIFKLLLQKVSITSKQSLTKQKLQAHSGYIRTESIENAAIIFRRFDCVFDRR